MFRKKLLRTKLGRTLLRLIDHLGDAVIKIDRPYRLERELARGAREKWCTRRGCTTCGSYQMIELLTRRTVSDIVSLRYAFETMTWVRAKKIVEGLRYCGSRTNREAVMWILYMLWERWGDRTHEELFHVLDGTFAGEVLGDMKAHYAYTLRRQRIHAQRQGVKKKYWVV